MKVPTSQVTIYDVASAAGVSISTVSNALNRPDRVSDKTRTHVLEIADTLGYVPKAEAVSLARKAMRRIGVLGPFTSYASYLYRLTGVLSEAGQSGVEVSVFDHESAATAASPLLASIPIQGQFDGLIVMGTEIEEAIERRLFERQVPTILVDAYSERFPVVTCDDSAGGRLAATYLYGLGHRHFGYVLERQLSDYDSQALRRLAGFRSQLQEFGDCELVVVVSDPSIEAAHVAAEELLSRSDSPTAVTAHFDDMAVGVLRAAGDLGLAVPVDLAVMGYDDGPIAAAANLTTVRQPLAESGSIATRILLSAIDRQPAPRTVTYLDSTVIERATTAATTMVDAVR